MPRVMLLFLVTLMSLDAHADPACDNSYGVCMANCATDRSAERCMQRCMGERHQCVNRNLSKKIPEQGLLAGVAAKAKQGQRQEQPRH
jgi:hypothetical protein